MAADTLSSVSSRPKAAVHSAKGRAHVGGGACAAGGEQVLPDLPIQCQPKNEISQKNQPAMEGPFSTFSAASISPAPAAGTQRKIEGSIPNRSWYRDRIERTNDSYAP